MKIVDAHLHIGPLSDRDWFSIDELSQTLHNFGVEAGFVMPIMRMGDVKDDFEQYENIYNNLADRKIGIPVYYLTPDTSWSIPKGCKAVKLHPWARSWSDEQLLAAAYTAQKQHLILLIHTGYDEFCCSKRFNTVASQFEDVRIVLCHGRPIDQTIEIMESHPNVHTDTAFMSSEDIETLIKRGLEDRVMFGSDLPVNRWFEHLSPERGWYSDQIDTIEHKFSQEISKKIFSGNFERLNKCARPMAALC